MTAEREPCEIDRALEFLESIRGARPWLLYVFKSDGAGLKTESRRFSRIRKSEIRAQLELWDRESRNVYFLLANNVEKTRRRKADIASADLVWTDVDPEDIDWKDGEALAAWQERTRRVLEGEPPAGVPGPPTWIWTSGRGFWSAWALDRTCGDTGHVEEVCRALASAYGGDKAHDCSRVARLVGTRNAKTGRIARLVSHHADRVYSIATFAREAKPELTKGAEVTADVGPRVDDLGKLALPGWLRDLTLHGVNAPDMNPNVRETRKPKDKSAQLWRAVRGYVRCGLDDATILALVLDDRFRISEHLLSGKHADPVSAARRTLTRARASIEGHAKAPGSDDFMGETPAAMACDPALVTVGGGVERFATDVTRAILARMPDTIFRRGGQLVRLRVLEREERDGDTIKRAGSVEIAAVELPWLRLALDRSGVRFQRVDAEGEARLIDPPHAELSEFIRVADELPFDELRAIARTPTLRRDAPGFDAGSGLYLWFQPGDFPSVPERPTRHDALEAARRLWGDDSPFRAFPFASGEARAVLASMLLSGVIRGELPTCPMHIADAPTPGTGKDLLIECVGVIVSGVLPQRIQWSGDENEPEKRLGALLLAGAQCIQIGNVERPIGGSFICDVLTSDRCNVRVLGESRAPLTPTRALIMASGNNVRVRGDMTRRVLFCRLDAGVEQPEQRRFDFSAFGEATGRRPEMVAAALTILRAYDAAGRPKSKGHGALGSYEAWDSLVRGAILWLDEADPVATQVQAREGDEDGERNRAILAALYAEFKDGEFRTDDVGAHMLAAHEIAKWLPRGWDRRLAGRLIGKLKDRPIDGKVLRSRSGGGGYTVWRIEAVEQ